MKNLIESLDRAIVELTPHAKGVRVAWARASRADQDQLLTLLSRFDLMLDFVQLEIDEGARGDGDQ